MPRTICESDEEVAPKKRPRVRQFAEEDEVDDSTIASSATNQTMAAKTEMKKIRETVESGTKKIHDAVVTGQRSVDARFDETNDVIRGKQSKSIWILNEEKRKLEEEKNELRAELNFKNDMLISMGYAQDAVMKKEYTRGRVVARVMHIESVTVETQDEIQAMKLKMGSMDSKLDALMAMLQSSTRPAQ